MFPQEVHRYRRTGPHGRDAEAFRIPITTVHDHLPDNCEGEGHYASLTPKIPKNNIDQELVGGRVAPTMGEALEILLEALSRMLAYERSKGRCVVTGYEPIRAPGPNFGDINKEAYEEGRRFEAQMPSSGRQHDRSSRRPAEQSSKQRSYRRDGRERREKPNEQRWNREDGDHREKARHRRSGRTEEQHRSHAKHRSSGKGETEHRRRGDSRWHNSGKADEEHRKGSGVGDWLRRMSEDLGLGSR